MSWGRVDYHVSLYPCILAYLCHSDPKSSSIWTRVDNDDDDHTYFLFASPMEALTVPVSPTPRTVPVFIFHSIFHNSMILGVQCLFLYFIEYFIRV